MTCNNKLSTLFDSKLKSKSIINFNDIFYNIYNFLITHFINFYQNLIKMWIFFSKPNRVKYVWGRNIAWNYAIYLPSVMMPSSCCTNRKKFLFFSDPTLSFYVFLPFTFIIKFYDSIPCGSYSKQQNFQK